MMSVEGDGLESCQDGCGEEEKADVYICPDSAVLRTLTHTQSTKNHLRFYLKYYIGVTETDKNIMQNENFQPQT